MLNFKNCYNNFSAVHKGNILETKNNLIIILNDLLLLDAYFIMNKEKKLQVVISSTYKDLIDERQGAVEAVLNAGMELFKTGNQTQKDIIREWIEE